MSFHWDITLACGGTKSNSNSFSYCELLPHHHFSGKSTPISPYIIKLWRKIQSNSELYLFKCVLSHRLKHFYGLGQNKLASLSEAWVPYPPELCACKSGPDNMHSNWSFWEIRLLYFVSMKHLLIPKYQIVSMWKSVKLSWGPL